MIGRSGARILFLSPSTPFGVESGTAQRTRWLHSALPAQETDLVHMLDGPQTAVKQLAGDGHEWLQVQVAPTPWPWKRLQPNPALTAQLEEALGRKLSSYSVVVARYATCAARLAYPLGLPVVVDLDDHHYRRSALAGWTLAQGRVALSKRLGRSLVRRELARFAHALAVTPADQAELQDDIACTWLPNAVAVPETASQTADTTDRVLFVGSLWYAPNALAVNWFLRRVWPQILRQRPRARLTLVGAASTQTRGEWESIDGVDAPGFIADLPRAYAESAVVVVPLQEGGGSSIKVLEALAHARPCVVSHFAAEAFAPHLQDGQHLWSAGSAADFASRVVDVLSHPHAYVKVAEAGRAEVATTFSVARFQERAAAAVRQAVSTRLMASSQASP